MREELSNIYQCQFINLNVPKNETLDCVLIKGSRINRRSTLLQDEETQSRPVIILCCPNAGYYEYMCYEVTLLEFERELKYHHIGTMDRYIFEAWISSIFMELSWIWKKYRIT